MTSFSVLSQSQADTAAIAGRLAPRLRSGDVVLLTGDLAAGKTTLVQALAAALGSDDPVTSPTFALVQNYAGASGPILHADVYRLAGIHEFRDLGLDEFIEESITLIEWGESVAEDFPCHLSIGLERDDSMPASHRKVTFASDCDAWHARITALRDELAAMAGAVSGGAA
jgi:tRNA threonylcarbamoyladenosine biosynthesis protein TsaE